MKKLITKKTILFISIVLISGLIISHAFAHMGGGYNMMNDNQRGWGYGMMGNGYMMEVFSGEDQQKMLDQMNTFFASTREIREQSYQKRLELNKEYAKSEKDEEKIISLKQELFDLSSKFEKERFNHMTGMQQLYSNNNIGNYMGMSRGYGSCF